MKKNKEKINIKYNFLAFIDALRSKHTLKTLTNLIKELPRVKKNFQRIKKYGFKHIFKYLSYEIFGGHIIKRYYDKLEHVKKQFSEIYFIQSEHLNRWSPLYNNDKLLVLIKS